MTRNIASMRVKRRRTFKTLDVPGLEDDYYTNLLDWSVKNQIAISLDNKVYLYDYQSEKIREIYEAFDCESVTSLAHNPEGTQLAFGNLLGQIFVHDIEKSIDIRVYNNHSDRIGCLDWKSPGMVSGSKDRTGVFTDPRMKSAKGNNFCFHSQEICGIKWNNELNLIATGGNDNKVNIWVFGEKKALMNGRPIECFNS